jgi:hypothetical protein
MYELFRSNLTEGKTQRHGLQPQRLDSAKMSAEEMMLVFGFEDRR